MHATTDVGPPVVYRWKISTDVLLKGWSYDPTNPRSFRESIWLRVKQSTIGLFLVVRYLQKNTGSRVLLLRTNVGCLAKFSTIVKHLHKATSVRDSDHSDVSTASQLACFSFSSVILLCLMFSSPTPCLRIWFRPSLLCDSSSHVICDVWFRHNLNQTSYIPCSFHIHWTSSSDVRLVRVIHPSSSLWSYSLVILASVSHSLVKQALVIHLWYRAVAFHLCFSFRCFKFQHISPLVTFTGIRRWDLRRLI